MKPTVGIVIVLLILAAAAGRMLWYYGEQPAAGEPIATRMPVACAECGQAYVAEVGRQPSKCHYCGKQSAWRAQQCRNPDCKTIFPMIRNEDNSLAEESRKCPKCGSERVGEVSPDDISEPE